MVHLWFFLDPYVSVLLSYIVSYHMSSCYRDGYDGHPLRDTLGLEPLQVA